MRSLKWISIVVFFCLLLSCSATFAAEDNSFEEIEYIDEADAASSDDESVDDFVEEIAPFELDSTPDDNDYFEPTTDFSDQTIPKNSNTDIPLSAPKSGGDFEIDEEGTLVRYKGFDKKVVIPNSVKTIGYNAFEDDETLESVSIPSSVTSIGGSAFSGCTNLKSIVIPNSVKEIGYYAFLNCGSLTSIQLSSKLTTIEDGLFMFCQSLKTITIPSGIKSIGSYAFSDCDSLKSVVIPSGVTSIVEDAFASCDLLESVTIPSSVTTIDRDAFDYSDKVIIRGTAGSYAEKYAKGMGIPFNAPIVSINDKTIYISDDNNDFSAAIVYISQTRSLKAVQSPSDLATTLKWSSSNTKVATVDQNGKVKGIKHGTATITAATANGKGKAAKIKIYVPEPTTIEFYDDTTEFALGETDEVGIYTYTPYYDGTGTVFPVSWSTSNKSIVSIEKTKKDPDGYSFFATIRGNKTGKATITATTPDGGKASITVTVVPPLAESIVINQKDPIRLVVGNTCALTTTITPKEATPVLVWSSDDKDIATVSKNGVITAVSPGWVYIYVEDSKSCCLAGIEVEVTPLAPTSIKLDKSEVKIGVKESLILKAILSPKLATSELTWTSSNPKVASVDENGKITANKKGTAVITVTTANKKSAKATITVKPQPKKVKLNKKGTVKIRQGNTLTLKAKIAKTSATTLTWTSSNPKVAKVDQTGKVTGVSKGTVKISVKAYNGKKASVKIKVLPPEPTDVKISASAATMKVKQKMALSALLTPNNAESKLKWKSSNKKIATVNKKGVVTAKKKGKVVITVVTANKKKATFTIVVN